MRIVIPRYAVPIDVACRCAIDASLFGEPSVPVTISARVPEAARVFCQMYEAVLRRLFKECHAFADTVTCDGDAIELNTIDRWSSCEIVEFLAAPTRERYEALYARIRRDYSMRAEVVTLIVCRNLGIPARRLAGADEAAAYWDSVKANVGVRKMIAKDAHPWREEGSEYILVDTAPPLVLQGQTSPFNAAVTQGLLYNKHWTSVLLTGLGYRMPPHVVVSSEADLTGLASSFETLIFKPLIGSRRIGVVGPVPAGDEARVRVCHQRCVEQITSGPPVALAQEYIHGTTYRINVNHGKVTFVLRSQPNEVVGDGVRTVEALLADKRQREHRYEWPDGTFVDNILLGAGRTRDEIPRAGERVVTSQDGTEGGLFVDATDEFEPAFTARALALAEDLRCPVAGIDAVVDARQRMWIVDVNPVRPTIGNIRRRAYETIEHMVTSVMRAASRDVAGAAVQV
jgi:hypothetical protein